MEVDDWSNTPRNVSKTKYKHKLQVLVKKKLDLWKITTGYSKINFRKNTFWKFLPLLIHWPISHERAIIDHIKYTFFESAISKDSKIYEVLICCWKYTVADKKWKNKRNFNFGGSFLPQCP